MVLVILNTIEFEAERFETRTMPTPDFKSKEVIYWIKMSTADKKLVAELQHFLESPLQFIELRVPSAFVVAKTELENYRSSGKISPGERKSRHVTSPEPFERSSVHNENSNTQRSEAGQAIEERFLLEIILRRVLPESSSSQTHSPYG